MKYYVINYDRDPRITGIRSGASPSRIVANLFNDKLWLDDFLYGENSGFRRGDFPDKDFKLEGMPLDKPAKHTDFISVAAILNGFIINEKVRRILDTCILPPHKYYEVTFDQAGTSVEGYYWLYYNLFDGSKYINYQRSIFDTTEEELILGRKPTIANYNDYISLTKQMNRGVGVEKIVFNKTFDSELDLFGMRFWGSRNYVSDRLKYKLEEHGIVGYELRFPPIDPILEWE
jgi:hypothetical protein